MGKLGGSDTQTRNQVLSWRLLRKSCVLFLFKEQRETSAKKMKVKRHSVSLSQYYILMVQPPNEILQHGALSCTLTADDRYLRQVQVAGLADRAEGVLELVDEGN